MERRLFFQRVVGDSFTFLEEISGRPQLRLRDLGQLPENDLLTLRPAFAPGVTVFAADGRMLGRCGSGEPMDLYGLDDAGTFVLSRFDGHSSLGEIADELATSRRWDTPRAQAHARTVFLRLVGAGLCAPANPLIDSTSVRLRDFVTCQGEDHE